MPVLHELAHPRWRELTRYSSVLISVGTPTLMPPQPPVSRLRIWRTASPIPGTARPARGGARAAVRRARRSGHVPAAGRRPPRARPWRRCRRRAPVLHRLRERRHLHAACRASSPPPRGPRPYARTAAASLRPPPRRSLHLSPGALADAPEARGRERRRVHSGIRSCLRRCAAPGDVLTVGCRPISSGNSTRPPSASGSISSGSPSRSTPAASSPRPPASAGRRARWARRAAPGRGSRAHVDGIHLPAQLAYGAQRHHVRLAGRRADTEQREQACALEVVVQLELAPAIQ